MTTAATTATYACAVIGSGTFADPWRPAINDIKTATGQPAFQHHCAIPTDPVTGKPTVATIDVVVLDNSNAALVAGHPQITPVATTGVA